jgi:glycosyltransferase involved in cell wall biosynthesis
VESVREQGRTNWSNLGWTDNIEKESPVLANVARFDPKKRREDLIKALPRVVEEYPDISLVLTGRGPEKEQIQNIAKKLGVASNVFCIGFVENPQSVYYHADIVLLPSISEGFSIGMLEAMAHGKPIVATDIPPFREALGEAHSLVSPYSPDEITSETLRILSDSSYSTELGDRAFNRVSQLFSGAKAAEEYEEVYCSIL